MRNHRSWKIGALVFAGVVVFAAALAVITLRWIIPAIIAVKFKDAVAEQWDGDLTIGSVRIHYRGPVVLHNVRLRDKLGRDWLLIETVSITFRDWPGTEPVITDVVAQNAQLCGHFVNDRLDLPLRKQPSQNAPAPGKKPVDLSTLIMRNLSLTMADGASRSRWDDLQLEVRRHGQEYQLSLNLASGPEKTTLRFNGLWNPDTADAQIALKAHLALDKTRTAAILRIFHVPLARSVEGTLDIDTTLTGRLNAPITLSFSGRASLEHWVIQGPHGDLVRDLSSAVTLNGKALDVETLTANGCGGSVSGVGRVEITDDGSAQYSTTLTAKGVDLPTLTEAITGPSSKALQGTLGLQLDLRGLGFDCGGCGAISLRQADVMGVPGLPQIFSTMGLPGEEPLRRSDGAGVFTFQGLELTIQQVRLANPVSALDGKQGGTVNLRTHRLDLYVIAVPLKAVEGVLQEFLHLPGVRIVGDPLMKISSHLTRLHVQGDWSDPTDKLVHLDALKDMEDGTVDFLGSMMKSGGKFGEDTYNDLGNVFK